MKRTKYSNTPNKVLRSRLRGYFKHNGIVMPDNVEMALESSKTSREELIEFAFEYKL